MKNFIFKSTDADLQKMFQYLETIQKNVLYLTYRIDAVLKTVTKLEHKITLDKDLQKQVDEYFEEDMKTDIPNKVNNGPPEDGY